MSISKTPIKGQRNILITSALPYSNATPHLGNLIGCVLSADVYSRFTKQRGYNSLYICGTDEYGTATEFKALQENCTPRQISDKYHKIHKEIYKWFEIEFDRFGRTSTPLQTEICTDIYKKLERNGYIEERKMEQQFCEKCDRFLADRFVEGICPSCAAPNARGDQCDACSTLYEVSDLINPCCKRCGGSSTRKSTKELFLTLKKLLPKIEAFVNNAGNEWTENTVSVTKAWLSKLEDRCITRSLKWGTPVPREGFEDKVFYVWFDAPIGYISITAAATENWKDWWYNEDVELCQFMGKDNIPFHSVIFPGTLLGTGENYTMAKRINTTEHLLYEGGKFSKSLNRGVFGDQAQQTNLSASIWRYYLLSNRPETTDTNFRWDDLVAKANGELNNNLGNLVHRVLTFIKTRFNGLVPSLAELEKEDQVFIEKIKSSYATYIELMEEIKIKGGIRCAMKLCNEANNYFHMKEPWATIKQGTSGIASCKKTMNICYQTLRLLSGILMPFIPSTAKSIASQLNCQEYKLTNKTFELTKEFDGFTVGEPKVLFEKIPLKRIKELEKEFSGEKSTDFPLDLVVGTVLTVEDHPNADSLWILKVIINEKFTKTIITNLKKHYNIEQLKGKKVVVINNIRKNKFKGVASNGMLLCAQQGEKIRFVSVEAPNGDRILPVGVKQAKIQKNFNYRKNFDALSLRSDGEACCVFGDKLLVANQDDSKLLRVDEQLANCKLV